MASIEIFNKPRFDYRDECSVILLINAWELLLKALLSKNRRSIYYPKRRGESYRTLSAQDALTAAQAYLPATLNPVALRSNLDLLTTYRNNAVHFYNAEGFGAVIYSLAQAAIVNYRDLAKASFGFDIANEMSWVILPLGRDTPVDPVAYMNKELRGGRGSGAVRQFLNQVAAAMAEVKAVGGDAGRLLTTFTIKLESVKKVREADVVVGVVGRTGDPAPSGAGESGPLAIVKTLDPNVTHPLRQREVLQEITTLHGRSFTSRTFQAVVWERNLKDKPQFCWAAREGFLTKYSRDVLTLIRAMTAAEVDDALAHYGEYQRRRARRRKARRRVPELGTE